MSRNRSLLLLWILQLGLGLPGRAQSGGRVEIVDLTGRFLVFYDSATTRHADPDLRWQLWRRLYNFAAVPPTPFGDSLARQLLDSAWTKYPAALATIERGPAGLGISPDSGLERVLGLLKCGDSVKLRVTVFVGGFEGNAFGCAPFRTGYGGSLAELVVTEGLAMRVVQAALPGYDDEFYTAAALVEKACSVGASRAPGRAVE
jgi:hypothetical protein